MQILNQIIESVRLETPCHFIKKDTDDILASKTLHIKVFNVVMGQVGIEYTPNPGRLDTYFQIEEEVEWGETKKEAREIFSGLVSPWLKQQYELIDKKELMRMISGRPFEDMRNDPAQEIMYFDGPIKVQVVKCINQIKITIYRDEKDKLFYSDEKIHIMTFRDTAKLEQKWNERVEDFAQSLKPVDESYFAGKYEIIHQPDTLKPLVFVEDKEK